MLQYWKGDAEGERPVVFLHVPGGTEEVDLVRGRKVVLALIRALAEGTSEQRGDGRRNVGRAGRE